MDRRHALAGLLVAVWFGGLVWGSSAGWSRDTVILYVAAPLYLPALLVGAVTALSWVATRLRL